ncbi:MAG: hypothetical protein KDA27_03110 [Candidatus Eisenbacteria bacterium]|uniref:Cytochrome C Planctomycete-type domain-containing protein n=1 Tax=Eiseniibacteriota bacterium TaxID=2212470 RepID=A0A956N8Q9_UNCEI|nr:hypothetical protein [Candidatus Eisenbacteria bacterium]
MQLPIRRSRLLASLSSLAIVALIWGCSAFDDYLDKDPDAFLGPPPDLTPPVVTVQAPAGADSLHASPVGGRDAVVEVAASDDIELREVAILIDDRLEALLTDPPFTFTWDTTVLDEGSVHRIWARATDSSDNSAESDTVYAVVFNAGPRIRIMSPERSAFVQGDIEIEVEADDPRVPIQRVDFLIDGIPIGSDSNAPFSYTWSSQDYPPGSHFLSAMATGENGSLGISPFVSILLNNSPPRVQLEFPETGRAVAHLGTIPFSASAVDTVHGAIPDSLLWTSSIDGEIGRGGYFWKSGLTPGVHDIVVSARNAWGLESSDEIQLVVRETPTISLCWDMFYPFILTECYVCHNPGAPEIPDSEFDMSTWITMLEGGKSQRELGLRALVPCKPDSSLIWIKITDDTPLVGDPMPPPDSREPLTPEQKEMIRIWIEEGAPPDEGLEGGC